RYHEPDQCRQDHRGVDHRDQPGHRATPRKRWTEAHSQVVPAAPQLASKERPQADRVAVMHAVKARITDDAESSLSNPVAEIDVLARFKRRVESADRFEDAAWHRQVAAPEPFHIMDAAPRAAQMPVRALNPGAVIRRSIL